MRALGRFYDAFLEFSISASRSHLTAMGSLFGLAWTRTMLTFFSKETRVY